MIDGELVRRGVVDNNVEVVCRLWLYLEKLVACRKSVVTCNGKLLQQLTLQHRMANVHL